MSSKDPLASPVIQPNFLSEKEDLDQLIKGVKIALDIVDQPELKSMVKEIVAPLDWSSDEALALHIKNGCETVYHP